MTIDVAPHDKHLKRCQFIEEEREKKNETLWVGNTKSASCEVTSHHLIVNHFPLTFIPFKCFIIAISSSWGALAILETAVLLN